MRPAVRAATARTALRFYVRKHRSIAGFRYPVLAYFDGNAGPHVEAFARHQFATHLSAKTHCDSP